MLLSLTTTHRPATDLSYLLHKHPDRLHSFRLPFGLAYVHYPECNSGRACAVLTVDADFLSLSRMSRADSLPLVSDQAYVAGAMLSLALLQIFASTLNGTSRDRPHLVQTELPLTARLASLRQSPDTLTPQQYFGPLGYAVSIEPINPSYYSLGLAGSVRLQDLLKHLVVGAAVLDQRRGYWLSPEDCATILAQGQGWLGKHPEAASVRRALSVPAAQRAADPIGRLLGRATEPDLVGFDTPQARAEVLARLRELGVRRLLLLGAHAELLRALLEDSQLHEVIAADIVQARLLEASERLPAANLPERARERLRLVQTSLVYRDRRLLGVDAVLVTLPPTEHYLAGLSVVLGEWLAARQVIVPPGYQLTLPGRYTPQVGDWLTLLVRNPTSN
jgi:3' terminal RNA ribose 2'-O-methyltransferase Hen1